MRSFGVLPKKSAQEIQGQTFGAIKQWVNKHGEPKESKGSKGEKLGLAQVSLSLRRIPGNSATEPNPILHFS